MLRVSGLGLMTDNIGRYVHLFDVEHIDASMHGEV